MNEVIQTILNRRSCKQYLDRPVPEELLDQVLLAGTYAANGRGKQAGRIVALTRPQDVAALERLNARALGNPEAHPFYGAPVVLAVLADRSPSPPWKMEVSSSGICCWPPNPWAWALAGSTVPGRNSTARRAKRCWPNGASLEITSAWATAFWAIQPQIPRRLHPEKRILLQKSQFEVAKPANSGYTKKQPMNKTLGGMSMKTLWKFAAALAAIAGAVVLIARYGDRFLSKLQGLRDHCGCHHTCSCGEHLSDAAEAVQETVEHVVEKTEEVADTVVEAAEEAVEAARESLESVTEEDFAD